MSLATLSFLACILLSSFIIICGQSSDHDDITNTTSTPKTSFRLVLRRRNGTRRAPPPLSKNFFVTEVGYQLIDEYYTMVKVGTPPQEMALNIDTGSSESWVRCFQCDEDRDDCFQFDTYFRKENSESYSKLPCEACILPAKCNGNNECIKDLKYGDGKVVTVVKASETIFMTENDGKKWISSRKISNVPLGCAIKTSGFTDLDGSLGLGTGKESFYSVLKSNYGVKVFSYCLVDQQNLKDSDMIFGEQNSSQDTVYTPMFLDYASDHYSVMLSGINVNGEALTEPSLPIKMIVDSGASRTHLPQPVYNALLEKFLGVADKLAWGKPIRINTLYPCYSGIGPEQISEASTMNLTFKGDVDLFLLPEKIWRYVRYHDAACLTFADASTASKINVLGNFQQQGIRVIFNQTDENRIGFDPDGC